MPKKASKKTVANTGANPVAKTGPAKKHVKQAATDMALHAEDVVKSLAKHYQVADCALQHRNAFELIAATILSAQCTDERVNLVTPALFKRFPTPKAMAAGDVAEIEELVRSTGFFRNKAANLHGMALALVEHHDGQVPQRMEDLIQLPGVGRKTASVVLGTVFGIAEGIVVDTHVKRLSGRLGLTTQTTPEKIEQDLMAIIPREEWILFSHRMIHHGRQICDARKPRCSECPLLSICPRSGLDEIGD